MALGWACTRDWGALVDPWILLEEVLINLAMWLPVILIELAVQVYFARDAARMELARVHLEAELEYQNMVRFKEYEDGEEAEEEEEADAEL